MRECGWPAPRNPVEGTEARTENDRSAPLPPAIEGPPRRSDSDRPSSPATSLPSDSDEATLDAIAATGKPLTLAEAIDLAFRSQPRLRAQLESIAQARGAQQIAFSTFLPVVAGRYDVGGFSLERGDSPSNCRKASRDSTSYPASEPCLSASTSERPSSWPSSRSNGCSSTSAAGWASTSRHNCRRTSPGSRQSARPPDGGQRGRSGLLQRPQEPGPAADGPGCPPSRRGGAGGCPQAPARGRHRARGRPAVRGANRRVSARRSTPPPRRSSWPWRG